MKMLKNKKTLSTLALVITTTTLILSAAASIVISYRNNQSNDKTINPTKYVNNNVVDNDYLSQETGVNLFNLNVFEGKTLDEIDFSLIKSAMIPQDSSIVSSFYVNYNWPIIKNRDLNSFTFQYALVLANNEYDYVKQNSYMTIYLPLQVDSKEILDVNSFKELAAKATSEQYLNSFKETQLENNDMFQNVLNPEGIAFWKSLINQINAPFYYWIDGFNYNLDKDQILRYVITTRLLHCGDELFASFDLKINNNLSNKYEKITVNNNIYLRITLGKGAIELYDKINSKSYINTHESSFYIDITNWNK